MQNELVSTARLSCISGGGDMSSRSAKMSASAAFAVVSAVRLGANQTEAAAAAGISRRTLGNWLADNREPYISFAKVYRSAQSAHRQTLIDEILAGMQPRDASAERESTA